MLVFTERELVGVLQTIFQPRVGEDSRARLKVLRLMELACRMRVAGCGLEVYTIVWK